MPELLQITSTKNPRVKHLLELQTKSKARRKENLFIIEGVLEVQRAVKAGYEIETVFLEKNLITHDQAVKLVGNKETDTIILSKEVFEKVAYRNTTGGIIAVAKTKDHSLDRLRLSKNPLLLVTEAVEKPGNIGALLRTADAAGIDGLIICDPLTDLYNPNVIRSSIGGVFTVPVAISDTESVINWLKEQNIDLYCTALTASKRYDSIDFTKPSAIVMGTEATGLSDRWLSSSHQNIIIPMQGEMDSLNVSVSAAIIVFEAARQRNFSL